MLRVDTERWQQTAEQLREQGIRAEHPRSRERFLGLYEIAKGKSASRVGRESGRNPQTVMEWVHRYNAEGSEALLYRHSGGQRPLLPAEVEQSVEEVLREALVIAATPPQQRQHLPPPRWTLKRLVAWVKGQFNIECCRTTLHKLLKGLGLSWKKARKLLNKAKPEARAAFLEQLKDLLDDALQGRCLLIYIDEAHIHLDTDEGYGWSICGERFWVSSSSPGRAKVSFYGVYLYNLGQVRIFPYDKADQFNTIDVLKRLRIEFPEVPIKLIWDGASYHRAQRVKATAEVLDIQLVPLSAYSPDFMPVEHLWQWLREDVTYHTCYDKPSQLISQVVGFEQRINTEPLTLADRLWVKTHLKPEEEKLRVSS